MDLSNALEYRDHYIVLDPLHSDTKRIDGDVIPKAEERYAIVRIAEGGKKILNYALTPEDAKVKINTIIARGRRAAR